MSDYRLFGLTLRSELPLPELAEVTSADTADVRIRLGSLPADAPTGPGIHECGDGLVFVAPDVGRFSIADGREILVEPKPGSPARNLRLFLMGSVLGALVHQRGLLPLHANAVEIDGRAILFMGSSRAGKSTLAAWFHDRGFRVIADDVSVIGFDPQAQPSVLPGLPRLRLWDDALDATGRDRAGFDLSYAGDEGWTKFDVPLDRTVREPVNVGALCVLSRGDQVAIDQLGALDAAQAVFEHTYRGAFVGVARAEQSHWSASVRLVREAPIFRVVRRWGHDVFDEQAELVLRQVRERLN